MKNNNSFWSFLIWLVITIGLVTGLAIYQNRYVSRQSEIGSSKMINTTSQNGLISGLVLSMTEIAKHKSINDCWLLINNKVYDVTKSISSHPGGANPIVKYCGQEATQAFNTKDIGRPHSTRAENQLAAYYIGDFAQGGQVAASQNNSSATAVNLSSITQSSNIPASSSKPIVSIPTSQVTLDLAELAKHSSASNCWLLINNKIYNVTSFISSHPGGTGTILTYCGQEATQAFNTKDIGRPHSSSAAAMLASYYIGNLNQTIGQNQIQQNVQQTNTVVPPTRGRGGENDD